MTTGNGNGRNRERIAKLNDLARTAMGLCSRVVQTAGIRSLPPAMQSAIRERVETFDRFTPDNDPHGERDLGIFEIEHGDETARVLWKIDYYDLNLEYGSENPACARTTRRVLTIMLAAEY